MLLDPFLSQVISQCSEDRLEQALRALYPEIEWPHDHVSPELTKWLRRGKRRPGLSLSTGRRNSFNGMVTCALLQTLEIDRPKAPRDRLSLAWAILDSREAQHIVGRVEELESARAEWRERVSNSPPFRQ